VARSIRLFGGGRRSSLRRPTLSEGRAGTIGRDGSVRARGRWRRLRRGVEAEPHVELAARQRHRYELLSTSALVDQRLRRPTAARRVAPGGRAPSGARLVRDRSAGAPLGRRAAPLRRRRDRQLVGRRRAGGKQQRQSGERQQGQAAHAGCASAGIVGPWVGAEPGQDPIGSAARTRRWNRASVLR
jgi:hypothetical protein